MLWFVCMLNFSLIFKTNQLQIFIVTFLGSIHNFSTPFLERRCFTLDQGNISEYYHNAKNIGTDFYSSSSIQQEYAACQ